MLGVWHIESPTGPELEFNSYIRTHANIKKCVKHTVHACEIKKILKESAHVRTDRRSNAWTHAFFKRGLRIFKKIYEIRRIEWHMHDPYVRMI